MLYKDRLNKAASARVLTLSIASACLIVSGCNNSDDELPGLDTPLLSLVSDAGLTGDPATGRTLPSITDAKAQLGKKLFFSKGLGGNSDSACVSCHHPALGGGDNLSLSVGVNAEIPNLLGPGRFHDQAKALVDPDDGTGSEFDGGPTVPRNAPTTFNIALWDQVLFHDGRVESLGKTPGVNGDDGLGIRTPDSAFGIADPDAGSNLTAAQSRFPVTSPEEMRGFTFEAGNSNASVRTALEAKLAGDWDAEFTAAFGDAAITYARIAEAIGEYERSQVFVNTPWKAYVEGNKAAISDAAKRGATMFFSSIEEGGANCASCHSGDFFSDEKFHVLATPQIGRGKGNDNGTLANDDFGRERETKDIADRYKFRTPSLLNVEVTGPWGHAGGYTTLEGIVGHMLNPEQAIANYDFSQLDPTVQAYDMLTNTQFALDQLALNRTANVDGVHRDVSFSEDDVADLVAFLKALTDPCVKDRDCLAPWIPDAGDTNPDALRVNAIDNTGSFL
jgi:cytochrome c peroxidase